MSKTVICVSLNDLLLRTVQDFARRHQVSLDFVLAVAVDQFLSDPDNQMALPPQGQVGVSPVSPEPVIPGQGR